jgi:hypothetical protein
MIREQLTTDCKYVMIVKAAGTADKGVSKKTTNASEK